MSSNRLPMWKRWVVWALCPASLAGFVLGLWWPQLGLAAAGAIGLGCVAHRVWRTRRRRHTSNEVATTTDTSPTDRDLDNPEDESTQALVRRMLRNRRYALLLRQQIAPNLEPEERDEAIRTLDEAMALVPSGPVVLGPIDEALEDGKIDVEDLDRYHAWLVKVEPALLDRYAVTNADFFEFVAAGGYESMAIWDEQVLPALLDFVDQTGQPGPRFWRNGCYLAGEERHPVVGVSWYEAAAYARWVGKRLPTDAEWIKAGCWPVLLRAGIVVQRKYPWGHSFDHLRANLWAAARGRVAAVDEFPEGVSVGGVHQLIGNVWEWTSSNFGSPKDLALTLPVPMKSIRGGAYDTYFENQATCHFQSGENPLNRKHNIGFRLALGVCDLAPIVARQMTQGSDESSDSAVEVPA